jgi:putative endonuclease
MRVGSEFEDQAADYLISQGFTVVTRRFAARHGELDIVALEGDELVFIEVRQRRSGLGELSITREKINRLYRAAQEYLHHIGEPDRAFRFDVVAVGPDGLRHHRHAFQDLVDLE